MDLGLKDKVIFVAGASRGIGLGIVEACLAEGAKVAIAARGAEALEEQRARLAKQYGDDKLWARAGDLRRIVNLPPEELERATLDVVSANYGATEDPVSLTVSRALGG